LCDVVENAALADREPDAAEEGEECADTADRGPDGVGRDETAQIAPKLEKELPVEPDLSKWLALFDAPI
jgi:hypothetical protein